MTARRTVLAAGSLLVVAGACARPTPTDAGPAARPAHGAPTSSSPALVDVGAPPATVDDARRLALKLAALRALVDEIERARAELGPAEEEAQAVFRALEEATTDDERRARRERLALVHARALAVEDAATDGVRGPIHPRLALSRLAGRGATLLVPEAPPSTTRAPSADDAGVASALAAELGALQARAAPVVAAAHVTAEALFHVEVSRRVLADLVKDRPALPAR